MAYNILKNIGKLSLPAWLALIWAFSPHALNAATDAAPAIPESIIPAEKTTPEEKPAAPLAHKPEESRISFGDYLAGRFAESQGDTVHGLQYLRDSYKRDPKNKGVQKSLYRMLIFSGNIEEALPLARKLKGMKVVPDGSEFVPDLILAIDEAKHNEYEQAQASIAAITERGLQSLQLPLLRAWLKLAEGDVKEPLQVENMARAGQVILPHMYLNAAFINDIAGFDKEAQKQYEAAVKDSRVEPFRAVEALANFYGRKGMKEKRKKLVEDYFAVHGESFLATELLHQHGAARTEPLVKDAKEGMAEAFYTMATIFHGLGVIPPADEIAILHLAIYLRADYPAAQFLLANTYEMAQEHQKAIDAYRSINPRSPYYERGRIRAVYNDVELGHKEEALAALDTLAAEKPHDIEALLAKGDMLRVQKKYNEAIETYDIALTRAGTPVKRHWVIYFSRGACYQLLGEWEKAEADMKKALALSPAEPEVLNYLGYSWLTKRQDIAKAKKMVEDAYDARPEDPNIVDSMGYALYVMREYSDAEKYFLKALERSPNDPTVNDHLGDTYWQLGRKTEARYQWERALNDSPDEETEKGLRKKLKEGLAFVPPAAAAAASGVAEPTPSAEE